MRVSIDHKTIEVVRGDITDQETEAIVNAANNHLWMGSGVAGAIKKKGGDEIEREAVSQGPIDVGEAILTSGGKLKAKYVIHAAAMGQDLHTDPEKITAATRSSLKLAESKRHASMSFPALGTGVGGFSPFYCAKLMITEAIEFLQDTRYLCHIRFVLFDQQSFDAFQKELELQFSAKRH